MLVLPLSTRKKQPRSPLDGRVREPRLVQVVYMQHWYCWWRPWKKEREGTRWQWEMLLLRCQAMMEAEMVVQEQQRS